MNTMNIDVLAGSIIAWICVAVLVFGVLWTVIAEGQEDDE